MGGDEERGEAMKNRDVRCPNEVALLMRNLESLEGARVMNVEEGIRGVRLRVGWQTDRGSAMGWV